MAVPAEDIPITEARDNLADVINRVHYAHEVAFLTRRGRRLAALTPVDMLDATEARAVEEATGRVCRELWQLIKDDPDEGLRMRTRRLIDTLMTEAEERADAALADAARSEMQAGVPSVTLDELRTELGL